MRDTEIFVSVAKGTPLRVVADKNHLSCTRIAQIVLRIAKVIIEHDPYMEHVEHESIAYIRQRSGLWIWAAGQLEQA